MKSTRILMGMPIIIEIADSAPAEIFEELFSFFEYIDNKFSIFKPESEISLINRGRLASENYSTEMRKVMGLAEETRAATGGYFNILRGAKYDPSGLVKGWAVHEAGKRLKLKGYNNFYIDAGGDIELSGLKQGKPWRIGVRNPFNAEEIVKVLALSERGVATSGTYERGKHIYNPTGVMDEACVSLTVVGPNVYEADRMATAAFAMGRQGIGFLENLPGCEGYLIDATGQAVATSGFNNYIVDYAPVY